MNYSETDYQKDRKRYGFLASLPIIVSIFHLLFTVIYMSILNYHPETKTFSNVFVLGELFASSSFVAPLLEGQANLMTAKTVPAVIALVIGLSMIFLSTGAVKGDKRLYYASFFIYCFDSVMIIPSIITSFVLANSLQMKVYDVILTILFHAIFLAVYIWGIFVCQRLDKYEEEQVTLNNTIHIHKGQK